MYISKNNATFVYFSIDFQTMEWPQLHWPWQFSLLHNILLSRKLYSLKDAIQNKYQLNFRQSPTFTLSAVTCIIVTSNRMFLYLLIYYYTHKYAVYIQITTMHEIFWSRIEGVRITLFMKKSTINRNMVRMPSCFLQVIHNSDVYLE